MKSALNIALIGYGMAGRVFHAPVISALPEFKLAAIVQRKGDEASRSYPDARILRTAEEACADPGISLVVVATPNESHAEIALAALAAGKHVIVDKPFTVNLPEAEKVVAEAKARGLLVSVFQNRRFDSDFLTLSAVLASGLLGRIVQFEMNYNRFRPLPRPGSWKEAKAPGSGIFYDLGSHLIDQSLLLFGRPRRIFADLRTERRGLGANDCFELILDYGSIKGTLRASMLASDDAPRFLLRGDKGSFKKFGLDVQEAKLLAGEKPLGADFGKEDEAARGFIETETECLRVSGRVESKIGDYREFYRRFAKALAGEGSLPVLPEEALADMEMLELAQESAAKGSWIDIEEHSAQNS